MRHMVRRVNRFVDFKVDTFLKVSGSLAGDMKNMSCLAGVLVEAARKSRIVAFPGGGPTDKIIETINKEIELKPYVHHCACARAQDQTGLMFSNFSNEIIPIEDFASLNNILDAGKLPILLPSKLICALDPVEQSWDITSDSIGAYFAYILEASRYVILKSIDGIARRSTDLNKMAGRAIYSKITATELTRHAGNEVDSILPLFLRRARTPAVILNGRVPERVEAFFKGKRVKCTRITPD